MQSLDHNSQLILMFSPRPSKWTRVLWTIFKSNSCWK
jgi:hypothetical protein